MVDDILELLRFGFGALIIIIVVALRFRVMDWIINGTIRRVQKNREKEVNFFETEWARISEYGKSSIPGITKIIDDLNVLPIASKQDAIALGKRILEECQIHNVWNDMNQRELSAITHSTKDNAWVFEYHISLPERTNIIADYDDFFVALSGVDGNFIGAWHGKDLQ